MGFSFKKMFSGSGWKKFKRAVGGVVKIATSVIPGVGGAVGGLAGKLLGAKAVGSAGGLIDKVGKVSKLAQIAKGPVRSTGMVLKMSPVMPGGAVATPYGVMPPMSVVPPAYYGPNGTGAPRPRKRRKASTAKRRSSTRSTRRRTTKGRLPKFGSPAWRKRFGLDKKRRKARKRGS